MKSCNAVKENKRKKVEKTFYFVSSGVFLSFYFFFFPKIKKRNNFFDSFLIFCVKLRCG